MKIFVAIPTYDGRIQQQVIQSLLYEQQIAFRLGDELVFSIAQTSNLPIGRDNLANQFLQSDCEKMFLLDSDISWKPGTLIMLCHRPRDFVAGCTRHKREIESYPLDWIDKPELQAEADGLLEIRMIGMAFVAMSRNVFKVIEEARPDRRYSDWGKSIYSFFEMPFMDGYKWGEDAYFCKTWREAGGKIYLDPELEITHWDHNRPFVGHIGNWLRSRMEKPECQQ